MARPPPPATHRPPPPAAPTRNPKKLFCLLTASWLMPTQAGGPAGSDRDTASTVKAVLRCRVAARWRRASGGGARDTRHGTRAPEKAARLRPPRVPVTGQWQATT